MEQEEENQESDPYRARSLQLDAVVTSHNLLEALKRVVYCLKNKEKVSVGMTNRNEYNFNKIIDVLRMFDIKIKIINEFYYKAGFHDGICKVIVQEGYRKN